MNITSASRDGPIVKVSEERPRSWSRPLKSTAASRASWILLGQISKCALQQQNVACGASLAGIGIDVVPVSRLRGWIQRYGPRELSAVFTECEMTVCMTAADPACGFAICLAGKEAVSKALGRGIGEIDWTEIEIGLGTRSLTVALDGKAAELAQERGVDHWHSGFTVCSDEVIVMVVADESGGSI